MNIKDCVANIELTAAEMKVIGHAIMSDLKQSIQTHYMCLQNDKDGEQLFFDDHNQSSLMIMKVMFELSGDSGHYTNFHWNTKAAFQQKREERATKEKEAF